MKTKEYLCLLVLVLLVGSGCAAAPGIAMYGTSAAGALYQGAILKGMFSSDKTKSQDEEGVIVYRDAKYANEIARKALKNLGIPTEKNGTNAVCGTTKDGVKVEVRIIEKTSKITEIGISAKKNGLFTDQIVLRMVSEEIKKLAGIS